MTPDSTLYDNPRVAAGYAFARPLVHPRILQCVREHLHVDATAGRALDVGCGAGRSTAALIGIARHVVGMDPAPSMLAHWRSVAPRAGFVAGQAERLPFCDATFDLVTAAGSINYADRSLALAEIARVLSRDGALVIYDFSAGRRLAEHDGLEQWYSAFERRYPAAPGYAMAVTELPYGDAGLALVSYSGVEVRMPMTLESYLRYVLSETQVALAIAGGTVESEIREWCRVTLQAIFADRSGDVIFDGYAAVVKKGPPSAPLASST